MLKRMVAAAALAGVMAGLALSAVQHWAVEPLLREAEVYEDAAHAVTAPGHAAPADEPTGSQTVMSNVALATGFALLLAAVMTLRRTLGARAGLLWGLAGYVAFFVAPALGLPPELPGSAAAPLAQRHAWWVATVAVTASGLWLVAFGPGALARIAGIALICAPHLIGAPQGAEAQSAVPAGLTARFVLAAFATNALLWLVLGGLVGLALRPRDAVGRHH